MPTYSATATCLRRLGERGSEITATSEPNIDDVSDWLDEAEAEALGAIKAGGGPSSFAAGAQGALILRKRVETYVAGLVRIAHAATGGDGSNEDGRDLVEEWKGWLRQLQTDSKWMIAQLDAAGDEGEDATVLRSHATDPSLDLDDRELVPSFTIAKGLSGGNF